MPIKDNCRDCFREFNKKSLRMSSYDKRFLCWGCYYHENENVLPDKSSVAESDGSGIDLKFHDGVGIGGRLLSRSRIAIDLSKKINSIKAEQKMREGDRK